MVKAGTCGGFAAAWASFLESEESGCKHDFEEDQAEADAIDADVMDAEDIAADTSLAADPPAVPPPAVPPPPLVLPEAPAHMLLTESGDVVDVGSSVPRTVARLYTSMVTTWRCKCYRHSDGRNECSLWLNNIRPSNAELAKRCVRLWCNEGLGPASTRLNHTNAGKALAAQFKGF